MLQKRNIDIFIMPETSAMRLALLGLRRWFHDVAILCRKIEPEVIVIVYLIISAKPMLPQGAGRNSRRRSRIKGSLPVHEFYSVWNQGLARAETCATQSGGCWILVKFGLVACPDNRHIAKYLLPYRQTASQRTWHLEVKALTISRAYNTIST